MLFDSITIEFCVFSEAFHDDHPDDDVVQVDDVGTNNYVEQYTDEQASFHNAVMESVLRADPHGDNFFYLVAPGGCGKTFVYGGLLQECRQRDIPTVAASMTAIAALLLPGGDTVHKTFGIRPRSKTDGTERSCLEAVSSQGQILLQSRLLVIDEVSMMSAWQVTLIDELLKVKLFMQLTVCSYCSKKRPTVK